MLEGHDIDADGLHDPDECYECLRGQTVTNGCRCAKCCHLLIEASLEDASREPRIKERGSRLKGFTEEVEGYLLNHGPGGACVFLDQRTFLCTIYATRPLMCRLFDCDGEGREQLIELGMLRHDEQPSSGDREADHADRR